MSIEMSIEMLMEEQRRLIRMSIEKDKFAAKDETSIQRLYKFIYGKSQLGFDGELELGVKMDYALNKATTRYLNERGLTNPVHYGQSVQIPYAITNMARIFHFNRLKKVVEKVKKIVTVLDRPLKKFQRSRLSKVICQISMKKMTLAKSLVSSKRPVKQQEVNIDKEVSLLSIHSRRFNQANTRLHVYPFPIKVKSEYEVLRVANRVNHNPNFVLVDHPFVAVNDSIVLHERGRYLAKGEQAIKLFGRHEDGEVVFRAYPEVESMDYFQLSFSD